MVGVLLTNLSSSAAVETTRSMYSLGTWLMKKGSRVEEASAMRSMNAYSVTAL